jgi:Copper type II ascorbate-dependent monooxygenase, C-terminal domain
MTLAHSARLLSVQPHMHFRGKSMEVTAVSPDAAAEPLLSVPKYDFQWQTIYQLKDSLTLPAGTRLDSVATFDNSPNKSFQSRFFQDGSTGEIRPSTKCTSRFLSW